MLLESTRKNLSAAIRLEYNASNFATFCKENGIPPIEFQNQESRSVPICWRNADRLLCSLRIPLVTLAEICGAIMSSGERSELHIHTFNHIARMLAQFKITSDNVFIRDGLRVGRNDFVKWDETTISECANVALVGMLFPELGQIVGGPVVLRGTIASRLIEHDKGNGKLEPKREFTLTTENGDHVFMLSYEIGDDGTIVADIKNEEWKNHTQFVANFVDGKIFPMSFRPIDSESAVLQLIAKAKFGFFRQSRKEKQDDFVDADGYNVSAGLNEHRQKKRARLFPRQLDLLGDMWQLVECGELQEWEYDTIAVLVESTAHKMNGVTIDQFREWRKQRTSEFSTYCPQDCQSLRSYYRNAERLRDFVKDYYNTFAPQTEIFGIE